MEWLLLLNFAAACFCAWVAKEKNRDSTVWFILGCLLGVLSLLAIAGMPKAEMSIDCVGHRTLSCKILTMKLTIILLVLSNLAFGHGGGLDSSGGHNNRKTGG